MKNTNRLKETIRVLGDPVLRTPSNPVVDFGQPLSQLAGKMQKLLKHADLGIGLAAPQVGVMKRMFVYDRDYLQEGPGVIVNPQLSNHAGEAPYDEACLSFPGEYFRLLRPAQVDVVGQDLQGNVFDFTATGLLARLILHESDHLDGVLLIDHLDKRQRRLAIYRYTDRLSRLGFQQDVNFLDIEDVEKVFYAGFRERRNQPNRLAVG